MSFEIFCLTYEILTDFILSQLDVLKKASSTSADEARSMKQFLVLGPVERVDDYPKKQRDHGLQPNPAL